MDKEAEHGASVVGEDSDGQERPSALKNELDALTKLIEFKREGHRAHDLIERMSRHDKFLVESIEVSAEIPERPGKIPCEEDEENCFERVRAYNPQTKYHEKYARWLLTGKLI